MTQSLLDRAVALATGEPVSTIRRLGFSLADPMQIPEDLDALPRPRVADAQGR